MASIISVRSTPELAYPFRVDLGTSSIAPLRLTAPPATPPGEYELEVAGKGTDGRTLSANIHVAVSAVSVPRSTIGRPPVIFLNGFQLSCTITGTGSTAPDSQGTFGEMYMLLEAESAPVLFFNNCAYNDITIEQLASQLAVYIATLTYTDGTPVTQVDLVAHSMGGLIVRAYLAGLQPGDGSFMPPVNPGVRKAVFIATPHFGSFQARYIGVQELEMVMGGPLLWDLATWNQRSDDLRGVDAIAVIGNAGSYYQPGGLDDGVVSLTSGSLSFTRPDQNTRVVPYCHADPGLNVFGIGMECFAPHTGIADIDSPAHLTWQIVDSFLSGTSDWATIGHAPSQDTYLSQYGGLIFAETSATGIYASLTQASFGKVLLTASSSSDGLFFNEFINGTGNLSGTSTSLGTLTCGPLAEPVGYYYTDRCRPAPVIGGVIPILPSSSGARIVASGGTVTLAGAGFGTNVGCSTCQVVAYPGPVTLAVSSWSDTAISALLPSSFNGFAVVLVQTAAGQDTINIMAAPLPSSLTIQTVPSGLQFSIDGGAALTAPQTFSFVTGSTHNIAVATPQPGAAGTRYVFTVWSDGGSASHSFIVNSSGTLTATFQTQYQLTLSAAPEAGGVVTPSSGEFYNSGVSVPISATAHSGYVFFDWHGNVAGADAGSTTVTMTNPESVTANFKNLERLPRR